MRRAIGLLTVVVLTFLAGWFGHSLLGSGVEQERSSTRETTAEPESAYRPSAPRLEAAPHSPPQVPRPPLPDASVASPSIQTTPRPGEGGSGTLRVRVKEFTGEAVPGVSISTFLTGSGPNPPSHSATTAADGTAEFPGLAPGEWHWESSFAEGSQASNASVYAGHLTEVVLVHPARGVRVEGMLRDVWKGPVDGVTVTLSTMEGGVYATLSTKTNSNGAYRFEGVRPGGWNVALSANRSESGFSQSDRVFIPPGETYRKDFVVGPLLKGRVRDRTTRAPIAGVQIQSQRHGSYLDTVTTDADGAFGFKGLKPGTFELMLIRSGYGFTIVRDVEVPEQGTDVDLEMSPAARLRLHVTDAEGKPATGNVFIGVQPKPGAPGTGVGTSFQADADGNATYDQILPGSYVLHFELKGMGKADVDANLVQGENSLEVRLESK